MYYSLAVACLDFEASFKTESNNASSESNIFSVFNVESYIEDDNYNSNGIPTLMNELSAKTRKKENTPILRNHFVSWGEGSMFVMEM